MGEFEDNTLGSLSPDDSVIDFPTESDEKPIQELGDQRTNPAPNHHVSNLEKISISIKTIGLHLWSTLNSSFGTIFLFNIARTPVTLVMG
jgi:hypothetical protein